MQKFKNPPKSDLLEEDYRGIIDSLDDLKAGNAFISETAMKVRIQVDFVLSGKKRKGYFTFPIEKLAIKGTVRLKADFGDFISQVFSLQGKQFNLTKSGVKSVLENLEADGGKQMTDEVRAEVMTRFRDLASPKAVEEKRDAWRRRTCLRRFTERVNFAEQESYLTDRDIRMAIAPEREPPKKLKRDGDRMVWGNLNFWAYHGLKAGLEPKDFERILATKLVERVLKS